MNKQRHCFVTDVGIAIEKLADSLDPERETPFKGDILDLLEWATKDVLAMRAEIERLKTVPMRYRRMAFNAQLQDENTQLRQQLAERDEQISDLTVSSDTYFAERNSARDVWRRASKDRDELRQQLAAALAACKLKDEALKLAKTVIGHPDDYGSKIIAEALAITPDDIALKAWLGEPVAFKYQNANTDHIYLCWEQSRGGRNWIPLYAPKVLKGL